MYLGPAGAEHSVWYGFVSVCQLVKLETNHAAPLRRSWSVFVRARVQAGRHDLHSHSHVVDNSALRHNVAFVALPAGISAQLETFAVRTASGGLPSPCHLPDVHSPT